jgi:hypothetical protein
MHLVTNKLPAFLYPLSQAILYSSSTLTSFCLLYPCSRQSSKASAGRSSSLFLSSWNSTASLAIPPHLVKHHKLPWPTSHIRSHSTSLKIQTSKGNYLSSLGIYSEQVDVQDTTSWEQNMDDLILRAAIWQDDRWLDRSAMLKDDGVTRDTTRAIKVVLLSLNRNLRLKARSRQLPAASKKDLAFILATG